MSNILFIQVDQMNHRCLSGYGNSNVATPNLDMLATEGMSFAQARCNNPICLPSRLSMLSGRYCANLRQYGFTGLCDSSIEWLPKVYKNNGYTTGAFGKMHAASIGWSEWPFDVTAPTLPEDQDLASEGLEGYRDYCNRQGILFPNDQIHGHDPFGRGCVYPSATDDEAFWMYRHSCQSDVPLLHSLENWTTDRCCDFLGECAGRQRPFFAWLSYDRPHYPTCLPEPWHQRAMLRARKLELPDAPDRDYIMSFLPPSVALDYLRGTSRLLLGDEDFRFIIATYYTLIEYIDQEIGRVMQSLRDLRLDDDTTVVFTSDHGDEAGYRGLYDKINGVCSEEVVRVPLIVRPAPRLNLPKGRVSHSPTELIDLYPTLCELCEFDASAYASVDGASLLSDLKDGVQTLPADRVQICEDYHVRSVVVENGKLVFDVNPNERQYYDLLSDPFCLNNLYHDTQHEYDIAERKRKLIAFLCSHIFGTYSELDVKNVRERLWADPARIGICLTDKEKLDYFRCAIFIRRTEHKLFIPFYEDTMLLFEHGNSWHYNYPRAVNAISMNYAIANALLDDVLVCLYEWMPSVSLFRLPPKIPEEIAERMVF